MIIIIIIIMTIIPMKALIEVLLKSDTFGL